MPAVYFTPPLAALYRERVEKLLFFNPQQARLGERLPQNLGTYGTPAIETDNGTVIVRLSSGIPCTTLYVLDREKPPFEILGILVYMVTNNLASVIHLALDEVCTDPQAEHELILYRLLEKLRRQVVNQGVTHILLPYIERHISTSVKFTRTWV